jgi:hypothetical protein
MTKEVWEIGEEGAKMLVEYVRTSDYTTDYRVIDMKEERGKNEQETTKETVNKQRKG